MVSESERADVDRFITTVDTKINALKLVEIARRVGREYSGQLTK